MITIFLTTNAARDLRDYFIAWPARGMVRFLYRADYREAAQYLNDHAEVTDVAISSALMGPWDRLALEVDIHRDPVAVRFFNPERALVWPEEDDAVVMLLASAPQPASPIDGFLADADLPEADSPYLRLYTIESSPVSNGGTPLARFANGLELIETRWMNGGPLVPFDRLRAGSFDRLSAGPGQEATLITAWLVAAPLDLPPLPIIANPPPPGVYSGPRLAVFAHLLAPDGASFAGDDGLWVDPLTLRPGDRFIQVHRFVISPDVPAGPYLLELGMYDPMTGDRWPTLQADCLPGPDRFTIRVEEGP